MNDTIKSILGLLDTGKPELQIAAAQVLGALAPREVAVSQALADRLNGAEDYLQRHVLHTLAAIGSPAAVKTLVSHLDTPGNGADYVAHLLAEIGKEVAPALTDIFDSSSPETQVRILGILAKIPGAQSIGVLEKALFVPELGRRAADGLLESVGRLEERSVNALRDRLVKVLAKREAELAPQSLAMILVVLGRIDGKGSRNALVGYAGPEYPPVVRHAALQALAGVQLTPTQATQMLDWVDDDDRVHVADPTIELLAAFDKWTSAAAARLRKLLSSRHDHLKLFALRAMRHVSSEEIVKTLMQHLLGDAPDLSAAAGEALAHNPKALDRLLRAFLLEKQVERSRLLARPLGVLCGSLGNTQLKLLAEKGIRLLLSHDAKGEVVLDVAIAAQRDRVAALLIDKAVRLRRARKLEEAFALFAFLAQREALGLDGRYQLAIVRLMIDARDGRGEQAHAGDATMGHLAMLVRDGFPVFDKLKRESIVTPEMLLRIGTHFTDGVGPERRFGSELLRWVAEKHGRRRAGEEARLVLRAEGL